MGKGRGLALGGRRPSTAAQGPEAANGVRLSTSQRERLAEAEGLAKGGPGDRQRAAMMVRRVEAELTAARRAAAVEVGIADTLARAKARGEAFEVEAVAVGQWRMNEDGTMFRRHGQPVLDVQTVRRASRVDGLANMHRSGVIDDDAKRWGDAYRLLWDRARSPVTTAAYDVVAPGGRDPGRMLDRVRSAGCAGVVVAEIRKRIGDDRIFDVLNAVAGQGLTIRSLGAGGDLNAANKDRLIAGLDAVQEVLSERDFMRLARQEH